MDTSLDNANNPFANSNGAENNILSQKSENLLLNLSDSFKRNGADLSPAGDFYHSSEKANGKRLASEFDDEEDLGPETDVDAVDDVLSPSIVAAKALADGIVNNNPDGSFNPFLEKQEVEKAALEIDLDLQKQQSSEFDGQRSPREETPTPPADAVHDGGLEENIGDSGEESEDEWNYIKGEEANKENINPVQPDCEVADLRGEDDDNMSQLNPNAAEFVPVSPTRSIPSPASMLANDPVIAQSPRRPTDMDIKLPSQQEFEEEVKSKPKDCDLVTNGGRREDEDNEKSPSKDLMDSLLNGKDIDQIPEFQPVTTPSKTSKPDEFHFGPNAAPFTPTKLLDQSQASTRAIFGDDTPLDGTLETQQDAGDFFSPDSKAKTKDEDPMSMSFYQDKDNEESDLFNDNGLNRVQVLPDNLEDFLSKSEDAANQLINSVKEQIENASREIFLNNDERIQTTDLDRLDDEKELASPVSNDSSGICELPKSPLPQSEDFLCKLECSLPKETLPDVCQQLVLSDAVSPVPVESEVIVDVQRTELPSESINVERTLLPVESITPELEEDVCRFVREEPKSQLSEDIGALSPDPQLVSQDIEERKVESPLEDITSSVKDTSLVSSPVSDQPAELNFAPTLLNLELELSQPVRSPEKEDILLPSVEAVFSSPIPDETFIPVCTISPKSATDTESVATADVSSFLERSQIVDLTSPMSSGKESLPPSQPLIPINFDLPIVDLTSSINSCNESIPPSQPLISNDFDLSITEPQTLPVEPVAVAAAAAAVAIVGATAVAVATSEPEPAVVTATTVEKTTKTPTPAAAKKTTSPKATPTSKAKPTTPLAKTKPVTSKTPTAATRTTPSTSAATRTANTKPAVSRPKPPTTLRSSLEKKPLSNGDIKASPKAATATSTVTRRVTDGDKVTQTKSSTLGASRPSPTKPISGPRPATAPVKTTTKPTATTTVKARPPPSLSSKTTSTTYTARTLAQTAKSTTTTAKSLSSTKAPSPPKPRPTTAPVAAKPRPTKTSTTRTSTDAEKQNKDSANKLTASRTVTSSTRTTGTISARTVTSTVRKTETKVAGAARTTTTKTSTTTSRPGAVTKKPLELTRNASKTVTKTTKIEKPTQNGVSTVVTEQITIATNAVNNGDMQLVKDNSPIDNKLIVETNAAD